MLQPKKTKKEGEVSNTAQEGLDLLQILAKAGGKSALRKVPFGIGSAIGLTQSLATGQNPNVSDMFGLIPNAYGQAAALTMMYAEKERQNLKDYAKNKMQGKNLSNIKPKDKELNLAVKSTIPETEQQELAFGTNQDGIMKTRMNPRKKYLNGSNSGGVTPNGIPSPASTLNDYQIMMAKAEQEAASNKWLPIVAMVGGLAQSAIGAYGNAAGGGASDAGAGSSALKDNAGSLVKKAAAFNINTPASTTGATAANGMNDVEGDVEVEGGEMYETPQGQTGEFEGPSHEQGGIPMKVNKDIPEGTKVYSDRLKVGKDTLAERKAARERKTANLEKTASTPYIDSALKNALKRKMTAIQKEEADDLAYQEQVNNMQQMADTVVAAFGTSVEGLQGNPVGESMRYANGTNANGVTEYGGGTNPGGIQYGTGYKEQDFQPYIDAYMQSTPDTPFNLEDFHKTLGLTEKTPGFGKTLGPTSFSLAQQRYGTDPNAVDTTGLINNTKDWGQSAFVNAKTETNPMDAVIEATPQETSNLDLSKLSSTNSTNPPGTMFSRALAKGLGTVNQMELPGTGDITKYIGNYLDMTSGIKTATEQRASDVTHQNTFANAGKDSQAYLDKSMAAVEGMKSAAEMKATTASRSSKFSANNGARGQNQKRAVDFLYDQGLAENMATIHANTANQVADIYKSKATTALSADQLKGTGQYQADMANEAAKDAYFTALGKGRNQFAEGLMQTGKDINDAKENKLSWEMQKKSGTHLQGNDNGTFSNRDISFVHPKTGKKVTITQKQLKEILEQQKTKSK